MWFAKPAEVMNGLLSRTKPSCPVILCGAEKLEPQPYYAQFFRPLTYHSERREESHNSPIALVFRNLAAPRKNFRFRASCFGFFDVAVAIVE